MTPETKDRITAVANAVGDWVTEHPWPIMSFVIGFMLGLMV